MPAGHCYNNVKFVVHECVSSFLIYACTLVIRLILFDIYILIIAYSLLVA